MDGIHMHLIQRGLHEGHLYTREFVTSGMYDWGEPQWSTSPKQDHLVCFLGGSLMLGAVTTGATTPHVSIPPDPSELTEVGTRDWLTGRALIETCMDTYNSSTCVAFDSNLCQTAYLVLQWAITRNNTFLRPRRRP